MSVYLYNDGMDRRVKLLGELTALSYDGDSSSVANSLSSFMLFPNASTVYNNDVKITRHIYAGSELIFSSVCNVDNAKGAVQAGNALRNAARLASLEDSIAVLYARHDLPFRRPDFAGRAALRRATPVNPNPETYFYHSDHLGNTSYVTDRSGALTQHVEYLPFGEPLLEQRGTSAGWQTDRLFNSKEYDAETGYYYYGARYYDPRLAIWLSPDPLREKYPDKTTYAYVANNPINAIDPDGRRLRLTNNISKGLNNLAQIIATDIGEILVDHLISDEASYKLTSVFWTFSCEFVPKSREINYVGSTLKKRVDNGYLSSMISLAHEMMHAYDFAVGNYDEDTAPKARGNMEKRAVSFANYIRSAYSLYPLRTFYSGYLGDEGEFQQFSYDCLIDNFKELGHSNDGKIMVIAMKKGNYSLKKLIMGYLEWYGVNLRPNI